ncbi:MAG: hypothetical protein RLN70_09300 [Rhodospirillaceae bacterium]
MMCKTKKPYQVLAPAGMALGIAIFLATPASAQQAFDLEIDGDFTRAWASAVDLRAYISRLVTPCPKAETTGVWDPRFPESLRFSARRIADAVISKLGARDASTGQGVAVDPDAVGTHEIAGARGSFDVSVRLGFRSRLVVSERADPGTRYSVTIFDDGDKQCAFSP